MLYAVVVLAYLGIIAYGSFQIEANFFLQSHSHGETTEKQVAITFDDGPIAETTPLILDILKEHQTKATFFCIGKNIKSNENLLERIYEEGHLIGTHSYQHGSFFDFLPAKKMVAEFEKADELIFASIGKKPLFFRPPYGVTNPAVAKASKKLGYHVIGWDIRSMDTVSSSGIKMCKRIYSKLRPGSIILLHDTNLLTREALPLILKGIQKAGYKVVALDQLLGLPAYKDDEIQIQ